MLGRYELVRHLATGGMAELWLSKPQGSGCPTHAVVKMIAPDRANDRQFVQMFLDEARVASMLHHPNIAKLYDVGLDDDTYFHVIEYVHGEDVRAAIERALLVGERTPLAVTVAIGRAIAAALHYAHERRRPTGESLGIVHRDVTPSNIMLGWDGAVKLVDFGVALAAGRSSETRAGVLKGKIAYMAPEQCLGKKVDRRADIFALGVVLYELSLRRRAFRGDNEYQTLNRIVHGDLAPPRQVMPDYPPELEAIVMRALATDPVERFATAAELGAALEAFAHAHGLPQGPAVIADHMRAVFGAAPPVGEATAPASLLDDAIVIESEDDEPTLIHDIGPALASEETRELPASLAAVALAPRVSERVVASNALAAPTRPRQFAFGTTSVPVYQGASARAETVPIHTMTSQAPWLVALAVLLAGVVVAAYLVLTV